MTTATTPTKPYQFKTYSAICGLIAIIVGFTTIIGWIFDIGVLQSGLPGLIPMKVNAAFAFIFLGYSLWQFSHRPAPRKSQLGALTALLISLFSLSEDILGQNLFISNAQLSQLIAPWNSTSPGHMSPFTAVCFILLSLALLTMHHPRRVHYRVIQACTWPALLVSYAVLIDYSYKLNEVIIGFPLASMPLNACMLFLLISTAVLAHQSEHGFVKVFASRQAGGLILRQLLPLILLVPYGASLVQIHAGPALSSRIDNSIILFTILQSLLLLVMAYYFARRINRLENDKLALLSGLELAIQERTQELQRANASLVLEMQERRTMEQQLLQSQKMQALGTLAGGIAHDFNNLLAIIVSSSELALEKNGSLTPLHEELQAIFTAANRGAVLTRQLLDFSRQSRSIKKAVNLNAIVSNIMSLLQPALGEQLIMSADLDPSLGLIEADPLQMEQVIMNLAKNARDAMPLGGALNIKTLNLELDRNQLQGHLELAPGPYVLLSVTDRGLGMSKEIQSRVFEPFFSTKDIHKATGLGLSIVFGIVKEIGGDIAIESTPGIGSTFSVYLPRLPTNPSLASESNVKGA